MDFESLTQQQPAPTRDDASAPERQQQEAEDIAWPPRPPAPRPRARYAPPRAQPLAQSPVALPAPVSPPRTAARARAGLGAIAACGGTVLGAVVLGGLPGAAAGLAGVGALRNLYRSQGLGSADPREQADAARSLAIGLVGVAIAGYLGYKAFTKESS